MQNREDPYSKYAVNDDNTYINKNVNIPASKQLVDIANEKGDPYSKYAVDNKSVPTLFGQLPKEPISEPIGSPKSFINKNIVDQLISSAAGTPGIQEVGKVGQNLISMAKNAFTKINPYIEAAEKSAQELESATKQAESSKTGILTNQPKNKLESIEDQLTRQLNTRAAHHLDLGKSLKNRIESVQSYWKNRYKNFLDNIKNKNIQLNPDVLKEIDNPSLTEQEIIKANPVEAGEAMKSGKLDKFIKKYKGENQYFEDLKSSAPTSEDTTAHMFLTKYKDFGTKLYNLGQDMKNTKLYNATERNKIADAVAKGQELKLKLKNTLDEGLGEYSPEWKEVNRGYETEYYPLKNNKVAKSIIKNVKTSKDVIDQLGGEAEGQELLRNFVKSDPEMLRNALGQQYVKKSTSLFSPRADVQEYLNESPDIQKLLNEKETELQRTTERKDIALKDKIKAEKELSDIRKSRKEARNNLFKIGILGSAKLGVPYGYGYAMQKLSNEGE